MTVVSYYIVPFLLVLCSVGIIFGKSDIFDEFIKGAREGLEASVRLVPVFVALCIAIELLKLSGAVEIAGSLLGGVLERVGVPRGLAAFVCIRPVSGSAAITMLNSVFESFGADSYEGFLASVIMGSGDTLVYIVGVYYSAVGINKPGYTLFAAIVSALASLLICSFLCQTLVFG